MALFESKTEKTEEARTSWHIIYELTHFIFSIFEDKPKKEPKKKSWFSPLSIFE